MNYHVVFVPEDEEADVKVFYTKDQVVEYLRTVVRRTGQVKIYFGTELSLSIDRELGQYFLNEGGHLPMPITRASRQELIVDGKLGPDPEPDPEYLAATRSTDLHGARPSGPGTTGKKKPPLPITHNPNGDEDDDDEDDEL